jgi:hypothetical protein
MLVAELAEHAKDGRTIGEAMLDVRRKLVTKGLPMVMALTSYGGAQWKLKSP